MATHLVPHSPNRAVAAARKLRGQTQEELAELLTEATDEHWSRVMVARLERGDKRLDVDALLAIANLHDLPVEFYLYGPAATVADRNSDIPG